MLESCCNYLSTAIVRQSLAPQSFVEIPGHKVSIFRKSGAKWSDYNCNEFKADRGRNFYLLVIFFGENDLAGYSMPVGFQRNRQFTIKVK